jgi:hypothetical protein
MLLEEIIKLYHNRCEPVFLLERPKKYEVTVKNNLITFIGPEISSDFNRIYCSSRNETTVLYYTIVAGLMYDVMDVLIDDPLVIGSKVISRSSIWKAYEEFEQHLEISESTNASAKSNEFFEGDFVSDSSSIWDNLVEYLENQEIVDHEDIAQFISPTFKQRIEAELQNRNMIKGLSPTKSLF